MRGWLHLHTGDASEAWRAFHRFGHHEDHPAVGWTREFRVHYYDFLSSAQGEERPARRRLRSGPAPFREFQVGMATQHGYYPTIGDYLHPDRKSWTAMRGDKQGPAEMSLDKMRERIRATRAAGAKAAVYLHPVCFDDAGPLFEALRDCVLVDEKGAPLRYPWQGPDTQGRNWYASLASATWRDHLLQQAGWIMELLSPDAIVVDETFLGLGYDHHPDRTGPISAGAIDFYRKLRSLVRSFGADRAVFSSDCSLAPFVYWFDGECGDHAYASLLGRPSYAREPVRFLAALGDKPWRPCAWHFQGMWDAQMKLARQVGAGRRRLQRMDRIHRPGAPARRCQGRHGGGHQLAGRERLTRVIRPTHEHPESALTPQFHPQSRRHRCLRRRSPDRAVLSAGARGPHGTLGAHHRRVHRHRPARFRLEPAALPRAPGRPGRRRL